MRKDVIYTWLRNHCQSALRRFRDRLHFERDSQPRRIFSSVGSSFRNVKWSDYGFSNINPIPSFRVFLKLTLTIAGFVACVCWLNQRLQLDIGFLSQLTFTFWYTCESTYAALVFSYWSVHLFGVLAAAAFRTWLYSVIKIWTPSHLAYALEATETPSEASPLDRLLHAQEQARLTPETALMLAAQSDRVIAAFLNSQFNTPENLAFYRKTDILLKKMFLAAFWVRILDTRIPSTETLFQQPNMLPYVASTDPSLLPALLDLTFDDEKEIVPFDRKLAIWQNVSVTEINDMLVLEDLLTTSAAIEAVMAEPLIKTICDQSSDQAINCFETSRWLYKYSIIHRRSLRKMHKINIFKKQFDLLDDTQNDNDSVFAALELNLRPYTNSITSIEPSYFWYMKRFDCANSLLSHEFISVDNNRFYQVENIKQCMIRDYLTRLGIEALRPFFILDKPARISDAAASNPRRASVFNQHSDLFSEDNIDAALYLTRAVKPTHLNMRNYVNFDSTNSEFCPDIDPIRFQESLGRWVRAQRNAVLIKDLLLNYRN